MQRRAVVVRHGSDVDWRRYRQEYINECSNYLSDPPRPNHPVIMLTSGRSHVIFVIWCRRSVGRSVGVRCLSPFLCFPFLRWLCCCCCWMTMDGPVTMLVGTRSRRRTEYVVVMVVRVRARRRWSRLLDWMWIGRRDDTRNWHDEWTRWGGASRWRIGWRMTGVLRDHRHL